MGTNHLSIETFARNENSLQWIIAQQDLSAERLGNFLKTLRVMPAIRYEKASSRAFDLGQKIKNQLINCYDYGQSEHKDSLVLIVDRKCDLSTPLLIPWTYQAIIDYLSSMLSIESFRSEDVSISEISTIDQFLDKNCDKNLSELTDLLQTEARQLRSYRDKFFANQSEVSKPSLFKEFVSKYPAFKDLSIHLEKHISTIDSVFKLIAKYHLTEISKMEQEIISCNPKDQQHTYALIKSFLQRPEIHIFHKMNLLVIAALHSRNKSHDFIGGVFSIIKESNIECNEDIIKVRHIYYKA